jgi:hypothetical protein
VGHHAEAFSKAACDPQFVKSATDRAGFPLLLPGDINQQPPAKLFASRTSFKLTPKHLVPWFYVAIHYQDSLGYPHCTFLDYQYGAENFEEMQVLGERATIKGRMFDGGLGKSY